MIKSAKKTTILALSMFLILALLSFGSAFAYFSDTSKIQGGVTLGHLEIELKQGSDTVTALATVKNLEPGGYLVGTENNYHSYTIDTSKSNIACYIRVKISSELEDVPSNDIFNTDLGTGWYLHNDGYYYQVTDTPATSSSTAYEVPATQNTVQLNVKIQLKPSVEGKEYMNKNGSYKIVVQALQADYLESISADNTYTVTELSNIWGQSLTTEEIFIIENGVLTGLTEYGKTLSRLTVPDGVISIGEKAFENNQNIVSVTLPNSVEKVEYRAFAFALNLKSINFPDSLTEIGSSAFASCTSLESIEIPEGITTIEMTAFSNCESATTITLPSTLKTISSGAFQGCYMVEEIILPQGLEEIGLYAFFRCENLININIPEGVKTIGQRAFYNCVNLININIPDSVQSIGYRAFSHCENAFTETLTISSNVTSIGEEAFAGCYNITDIIVEEGNPNYYSAKDGTDYHALISNDGMLIQGCNLSTIPSDVKVIGAGAFYECTGLTNIFLPDTLTTIGNYAFAGCSNLKIDLVIPSGVTSIGEGAFQSCNKLQSLTLNEGLLWIGNYAFNHCYSMKNTVITIPSTVVQIGGESYVGDNEANNIIGTHIFYNCATNYLTRFEVASGNFYFKTDNNGVLYTKNNKYLIAYPPANTSTEYSILEGCERLFELSMSRPYNLNTLYIPNTLILEYTETFTMPSTFANPQRNPLSGGLYSYTAIDNFVVNSTNPNYKSVNGIIYSKDGTRVIAAPTRNHVLEDGKKVLRFEESATTIENIFYIDGDFELTYNGIYVNGKPDIIEIGANIASIHENVITNLNTMVDEHGLIIKIDSNNEYYELVNGKIKAKNSSIQVSGAPNNVMDDESQINNGFELNNSDLDEIFIK